MASRKALNHTKPTQNPDGPNLATIIAGLNQTLRGWFGYFKYSQPATFRELDGWIRMRLRSILRKRKKKRGRGFGSDHQLWPNAFFQSSGLFSLEAAQVDFCQSF